VRGLDHGGKRNRGARRVLFRHAQHPSHDGEYGKNEPKV
jgi:hypothetical protein